MPGPYFQITIQTFLTWPPANKDDPVERRWLAPYAIALLAVSTVCVAARVKLRWRRGRLPWDDWMLIIAWLFALAVTVLGCILQWKNHFGRHTWDLPLDQWAPALYNGWVSQIMFAQSTCAIKVSILGFYWRMFHDSTRRGWLWTVYVLMFITVGSWIAFTVVYFTYCTPLGDIWNWPMLELAAPDRSFQCLYSTGVVIAVGVLTIASDFWCALLPCLYFQYNGLGSPTTRRQTIAMNIIFCNGFFVTGIGAARTYYLWELAHAPDLAWIGFNLFATALAELHLGLVLTCAPVLRVYFRRYLPNRSEGRRTPATYGTNSGGHSNTLSNLSASFSRSKRRASRHAKFDFEEDDDVTLQSAAATPADSGKWVNYSRNNTAPLSTSEEKELGYPQR